MAASGTRPGRSGARQRLAGREAGARGYRSASLRLAKDRERRDVQDDAAPPPAGFLAGRAPCPDCAPVVRDEDRIRAAAEASCSAIWPATIVLEWMWWRSSGSVGASPRLNGATARWPASASAGSR